MTVPVERLRKVVEESLGGTPGWLSLYGNALAVQHLDPDPALELTVTEASKVVREELKHFLEGRDRGTYMTALKAAALGTTWGGVRSALSAARPSPVNDKTVQSVLQRLRGAGFLFEHDGSYRVEDPGTCVGWSWRPGHRRAPGRPAAAGDGERSPGRGSRPFVTGR